MVIAPSNTQAPESVAIEVDLAKLSEQTFESEKAGIVANTGKTLNRFTQVLGLTAVLATTPAMAQKSPYEPLVDASGETVLVLKEDVQGKEELFAAFEKNETPEEKETFSKLTLDNQKKVIAYYQVGKKEQPNETKLLKGVYNLMYAYDNIVIAQRAFIEYNKTGELPTEKPRWLKTFIRLIKWAFPSAIVVVDIETMTKIDVLIQSMYDTIISKWEEKIKKWEEKIKKWEEKIKKLEEDIKIMNSLIQAL